MRRLALPLVLLLLLSACKVRIGFDTEVNADGSGRLSVTVGFDDEFREALEQLSDFGDATGGQAPTDPFDELEESAPEGWRTDRFSEGGFEGVRVTRDFSSLEDLEDAIREARTFGESGDIGVGSSEDAFQNFSIERDGDLIRVDARSEAPASPTLGAEDSPFGGEFPFSGGESPFGELEFEAVIRMTLPGKILEHNADQKDGNTLTWRLDQGSEAREISAVSDPTASGDGSDFPVGLVVAIVIALLAVGGFVVWNRRGGAAPAVAGGGETSSPEAGTAGDEDAGS